LTVTATLNHKLRQYKQSIVMCIYTGYNCKKKEGKNITSESCVNFALSLCVCVCVCVSVIYGSCQPNVAAYLWRWPLRFQSTAQLFTRCLIYEDSAHTTSSFP